jgi:type IV secretory pathway ATPase VirB11/archaellum biosynthesis ATPase
MGIRLRKANEKHQYADLELMVDDRSLTKKHVNLYEPAMFYTSDSDTPVQVVINSVSKNHIRGYIAEPKYRPAQLTAMSAQPAGAPDEKPRQKLAMPK